MLSRLALLAALLVASAQVPGDRAKKRNEPGPEANIPQCSVPTTRTAGIEPNAPAPEKKPDRLHKAFGPETGSNWALVVAAIWAGFVATRTLNSIESQVAGQPKTVSDDPSTCAIACWTVPGTPTADRQFTSAAFLSGRSSGGNGLSLLRDSGVWPRLRFPRILYLRASRHWRKHASRVDHSRLAAR
jgi:hypothetical protein